MQFPLGIDLQVLLGSHKGSERVKTGEVDMEKGNKAR